MTDAHPISYPAEAILTTEQVAEGLQVSPELVDTMRLPRLGRCLEIGICSGPVSKPTKYRVVLGLAQRAERAVEPGTLVGPG